MKEINEIPADELKVVVTELNKLLDTKIKTIGKKKSDVCGFVKDAIAKFIDEETADQLPDSVVDFYNEYIADEEEEEVQETKPGKKSGKDSKKTAPGKGVKDTDGKTAGKTAPGKPSKDTKKAPEKKAAGVVKKAVDAYMKKGIKTVGDIVKHLEKDFPNRNIKATVSHVVCVLNHVEQ